MQYVFPSLTLNTDNPTALRRSERRHTESNNKKAKVHPCTGTEALYRPYGP